MIHSSLSDKTSVESLTSQLANILLLIDNSAHCGVHKLWILQHLLVPRLRWPLMIYEVPFSVVIKLEQKSVVLHQKMAEIAPQHYQCMPLLSIISMLLTTSKFNISLLGSKK